MSQHTTAAPTRAVSDPSLRATIDADTLATTIDAVDALVTECVIEVDETGFTINVQDPATVALATVDLPASAFEQYEATGTRLGVDLDRLGEVVGIAASDELVRLAVDPETRTLHVRVGDLAYTLGLIDPDAIRGGRDDYEITWDVTVEATISADQFDHVVRAASMVENHVALGGDPDRELLYASADGDTDSMAIEYPAADCDSLTPGDAHSLYSTDYLDSIARVFPRDAPVHLQLGEEAPLHLSFDLADGTATYFVAPRRKVR